MANSWSSDWTSEVFSPIMMVQDFSMQAVLSVSLGQDERNVSLLLQEIKI